MKNYYKIYNKKLLQKNLAQLVRNNMNDREIYFITIAFKNTHSDLNKDVYRPFFKSIYQKINQYSVNNPSKYQKKKAAMILIPEQSHDCLSKNMIKPHHYHGFLMVHKNVDDKFSRKCIVDIEEDEIRRQSLADNILYQDRHEVNCSSCDIKYISSQKNLKKVSGYITKGLLSKNDRAMNFDLSDLRNHSKNISYACSDRISEFGISDEDIEIFCPMLKTIH